MRLGILIAVCLALAGCANPSIVSTAKLTASVAASPQIFIPRFEGNPEFVEESTDYFVAKLEPKIAGHILQGSVLRTETTDVIAGGNLAPTELALAKARAAGAQLLIMGKVTSHKTGGTLNGFSTVRIIDVRTGEIVSTFHRPSGLLVGFSEHQCVMAAVARTAADVAAALKSPRG